MCDSKYDCVAQMALLITLLRHALRNQCDDVSIMNGF